MIKPFKLLNGYTYSDEYTLPTQEDPPFNLSRRHWNMLPQDLRGTTLQEMECYIRGWEDARVYCEANPYHDRVRSQLWNRGFLACQNRRLLNYRNVNPNPPIDETYPEFYNTDEYVFFDVTPVMPDPNGNRPYKFMLFRHIEDGNTVQGSRITPEHPMWNFPDII
jgi:hypothetical protein